MEFLHSLKSAAGLELSGAYRFLTIDGRTGLNCCSLETRALIPSDLHREERGTLALWFSPLEDLGTMPVMEHIRNKDPHAYSYPLVSDALPARDLEVSQFGLFWNAGWYPKLMAKLCYGLLFPPMDFVMLPWVYVDALPLRAGAWYYVVFTWDRPARQLRLYVNGLLAGHNDHIDHFDHPKGRLHVGNPAMVFSDLTLSDSVWDAIHIAQEYQRGGNAPRTEVAAEVRACCVPVERAPLQLSRDASWVTALELSLTDSDDLAHFLRQGPQYQPLPKCEITPEGLLVQTPNELAKDTRTYLWSTRNFEGDIWIEFEFRPESPRGLALLVAHANGIQREDFIVDHGLPKGGAMGTIIADRVRNYHWEYFRRVEAMRTDFETQVLVKNPWEHPLAFALLPPLELGRWHQLRFIKIGARLCGSIDGQTVFDVQDDSWGGSGPIYNFGRIALRQMYHTTLRYRALRICERRL